MRLMAFAKALAALVISAIFSPALAVDSPPRLRLSEVEDVLPVRYGAALTLDPAKAVFTGSVQISLDVHKPVQTLWLNAHQITVKAATLTAGGRTLTAKVIPGGDDFLGFQFTSEVPKGKAEINISYEGVVRKDSSGVFKSEDKGNQYIFTQFESTDARDAFPCFDEPSYKVPWQLTITHPAGMSTINNSPVARETKNGAETTTFFKETKPLPSYLVAFGVGAFEYVPAGFAGRNRALVRIVTPKGRAREAKYAAEITAIILTRLEDYFGIPFPYEKSDQVAVLGLSGGAMENAGMVTYSPELILASPENDTIRRQRTYASVAAHELAHQWFGDLVTTAWWDDIWLNEAFATWMEQKLIAEWKPEWNTRLEDTRLKINVQSGDSLISARKIRQPIASKGDIANAFDGITYVKGAAVIGMFESWMGPDSFRRGVQSYMKQYAFRTTTAGEFLDSLSSTSKKDVTKAFSTFLNRAGVPDVAVSLDCTKPTPIVHLEQSRFLPLGSKGSSEQTWEIPVCIRYAAGGPPQSECALFSEAKMDMPLAGAKACPAWVQANDQAKGYYRMDYRGDLLTKLTEGNATAHLTGPERIDLIGNAQAMADAGKISIAEALALVDTFHDDPERQVVIGAITLALSPRRDLVPENLEPNYRRFLQKNFGAKAKELGWVAKPGESDEVKLLRAPLVRVMAMYGGDRELAGQARELALRWLSDRKAVAPDISETVLRVAAYYGDKALYERFLAEFQNTQDNQDQQRLLTAMNDFRDPAALDLGFQAVLTKTIPIQQGGRLLFSGGNENTTAPLSFRFIKAHIDELLKDRPSVFGMELGDALPIVGTHFCDVQSRSDLDTFFAPLAAKYEGLPRNLAQVEEGIDRCVAIKNSQAAGVAAFLAKY